jgi:hypothetical protein
MKILEKLRQFCLLELRFFQYFDSNTVIYLSKSKNLFFKMMQSLIDDKFPEIYLSFVVEYPWKSSIICLKFWNFW